MSTKLQSVYELRCSCNSFPWGKEGSRSLSARLCQNQQGWAGDGPKTKFTIDEDSPYAEMWMGTYPVLPSYVADTGEDLQDVIDRHPKDLIGEKAMNRFGHTELPYLTKVLSIAKALPLQLHPDKDMAAKLHKENPETFTDANHKPEIALALSQFEAFCGFKPLPEIERLMQLEPLRRFLPTGGRALDAKFTNEALREVVRNMLETDEDAIKQTFSFLVNIDPDRYTNLNAEYIPQLAMRLAQQFDKSDPGILVALITMNYLVLQPGEAIYIPADGIHAYLSGDIIECMARSNNVLNTGFCPKAERSNVDLFCKCLTFQPHSGEESMLQPRHYEKGRQGKTKIFAPPMSEFSVLETTIEGGKKEVLSALEGSSILAVIKGSGRMEVDGKAYELKEGSVLFVAPGRDVELDAGKEGLLAYTAFVD